LTRWIHERKNDHYHKLAKDSGYRSRAAYKLLQIENKFNIFEDVQKILDLGAAPGGWLQVASQKVEGGDAIIVGVDLKEIKPIIDGNVITIIGDITDPEIQKQVIEIFDGKIDVIMSDMSPDIIGQWDVDQYRQIYLARIALRLAHYLIKPDGWFITKIFQGGEHLKFIKEVQQVFLFVKNFKPKASRKQSSERYIIARNLRKNGFLKMIKDPVSKEDEGPLPGDQLFQDPSD
jgi:23S rRNA (uridine2552-2'-O)-methyltransferase